MSRNRENDKPYENLSENEKSHRIGKADWTDCESEMVKVKIKKSLDWDSIWGWLWKWKGENLSENEKVTGIGKQTGCESEQVKI